MKNQAFTINKSPNQRPRLFSLLFWITLSGIILSAGLLLWQLFLQPAGLKRSRALEPSRLHWLLTNEGERRGFTIVSDLARDFQAWELWGNGQGLPELSNINLLRPETAGHQSGLGFNGGYWDKTGHPVGVCAGQRGIHAARSHPCGFALAGGRAWIGPLVARVTLSSTQNAKRASVEIPLNPKPRPRRNPYLIDPLAYPSEIKLETPAQVIRLDRGSTTPLRFNTTLPLRVRALSNYPANTKLESPPQGDLFWIKPLKVGEAPPVAIHEGDPYQIKLALSPVQGVVRLATCAGPRLLKNGRIVESIAKGEGTNQERTWRTVVGCDGEGQLVWVVLLARGKDGQPGVTLREAAQTLRDLGAREGLNLDGGSSTSVYSNAIGPELLPLFPLQFQINHALFLLRQIDVSSLKP